MTYIEHTRALRVEGADCFIALDMDGTIADLYSRPDWLDRLRRYDPAPYAEARPLVNLSLLARLLHRAQAKGYRLAVISWLSKESTPDYDEAVTCAKQEWLARHLPSVQWDEIRIVRYGTPKHSLGIEGFLVDDEARNRDAWGEGAVDAADIMQFLKEIIG